MAAGVDEQVRRPAAPVGAGLRHVHPTDIEWIDEALDDWPTSLRWDLKGWTPSRPELVEKLWDGVVDQRVVVRDDEPVGLVQLVDLDLRNGAGRLDLIVRDIASVAGSGPAFLDDAMRSGRLRAVSTYAGVDTLDVAAILPGAREVGRLSGHLFRGRGRYEDVLIHEVGAGTGAAP